jgi:hypothetical protein
MISCIFGITLSLTKSRQYLDFIKIIVTHRDSVKLAVNPNFIGLLQWFLHFCWLKQQHLLHKWQLGQKNLDIYLWSMLCYNCVHTILPQLPYLVFPWTWNDNLHSLVSHHCSYCSWPGKSIKSYEPHLHQHK